MNTESWVEDSTENWVIKTPANWANKTLWTGDNLEVMRGMNSETIDLIYLDPPFNSNHNYAAPIGSQAAGAEFKDTWTLSDVDVTWLDLIEAKHPKLYRVINAALSKSDKSYLIYMAPRLIEMHRILKPTGSIYLHCDDAMSHLLRCLMDSIWGKEMMQSQITWQRISSHQDSSNFGRVTDTILFYGNKRINKDDVRVPLKEEHVRKNYRHEDERGVYSVGDMKAPGGRGYTYDFHGHDGPWRYPQVRMLELERDGFIHFPKKEGGVPCFKRYLHTNKGQVPGNIWCDISCVKGAAKERTGYPTQKPLKLLERIIKASSNEGDVILDPFCGCATTLVAADRLQRNWVGIDIGEMAIKLVKQRIKDDQGMFEDIVHRTDVPERTDIGKLPRYNCKENKKHLYGEQGGYCNGCREHFLVENLTIDHIIARSKGGTSHLSNLQLLCGRCNSIKGDRGQEYLLNRLAE